MKTTETRLSLSTKVLTWLSTHIKQDQARLDALDHLNEHTVLMANDWAMKFIPEKYRESQSDWFGKQE